MSIVRHPVAATRRFFRRSPKSIFLRSFLALLVFDTTWMVVQLNSRYNALQAAGNPFAGLVWNQLPSLVIQDALACLAVAGVLAFIGSRSQRRRARAQAAHPAAAV